MVRDLAGWQAQQQDQNMTDAGSVTGTGPLNPGETQPDDAEKHQREQDWQQYLQEHPNITQAGTSQVKTTSVEREESAGSPYLAPPIQNFPFDSIEELAEAMRHNGLRWRHNLRERVADDPNLKRFLDWVTYRPSPASEPTRSL
jgi:hypothetical protein